MQNEIRWGRGIAIFVVVGAALGVLYNAAGLMSHPKRGIPWLAAADAMAELDSLAIAPPDTEAPATREVAGAPTAPPPAEAAAHDPLDSPGAAAAPKSKGAGGASPPRESSSAASAKTSPVASAKGSLSAKTASTSPAKPGSTGAPPTAAPPAATTPSATAPASKTPAERIAPPPPFIPESDRPVRISLATTKSLFDAGAALFLDARDPSDYEAGHIPGALRLTRDEALGDPDRVKSLPVRGRPIVAYCSGGVCEASLELAQALVDAGYRKVLVYGGGFPDWEAAGYPVKQGGEGQ
jgi:rhodanese-related sulfurtransferase